jgi:hypothetical protein
MIGQPTLTVGALAAFGLALFCLAGNCGEICWSFEYKGMRLPDDHKDAWVGGRTAKATDGKWAHGVFLMVQGYSVRMDVTVDRNEPRPVLDATLVTSAGRQIKPESTNVPLFRWNRWGPLSSWGEWNYWFPTVGMGLEQAWFELRTRDSTYVLRVPYGVLEPQRSSSPGTLSLVKHADEYRVLDWHSLSYWDASKPKALHDVRFLQGTPTVLELCVHRDDWTGPVPVPSVTITDEGTGVIKTAPSLESETDVESTDRSTDDERIMVDVTEQRSRFQLPAPPPDCGQWVMVAIKAGEVEYSFRSPSSVCWQLSVNQR